MTYSRRQLEAMGEPFGESATQVKPGGYGRIYGTGGGGGGSSTTYTSNLSKALEPKALQLIAGAIPEYFNTDESGNITGVKSFTPYSTNASDYVAGFSPQQQAVFGEAANMQRPGQFQDATQFAGMAGQGGLDSAQQAYGYGQAGYGSGMLGQQLGIQGGQYYGGMGAGYGQQAANLAGAAQGYGGMGSGYGQRAANIGEMALQAQDYGRMIGSQAQDYAAQAARTGQNYASMATDPYAVQAYMSPYVSYQEDAARRDAAIRANELKSQATRLGAFGGGREALQRAQGQRDLASQLQNIRGGAYDKAIQSMQYGTGQGLAGLQAAQSGLGTALQGGQLGLSGIGQAIAGQQAGISGAGMGLQGLGAANQAYQTGIQGAQTGLQGVDRQLAGTGQGMQGAQVGLQGVSGAQAGYGLANQAGVNLANIGTAQQQADIARMGFQNDVGAMQRQREQDIINQAISTYGQQQENPFNRMSQYSGLIRGYYTPNVSQNTYQAQPALGSQIAGFGTALYGASQKRKGGQIKESDGIDKLALYKTMKQLEGV